MDVEEATTLATTEGENESEMETMSTTHGGDDLEFEMDSGDKPNKPETLITPASRTRELTFLRDIMTLEIWMQREKSHIDPAVDQSFLLDQRTRIDVFEETFGHYVAQYIVET